MNNSKAYINKINISDYKKLFSFKQIDIELTERCNNNCIHCYINQPESNVLLKEKELSLNQLKDIISQAAQLGCLTIRYTGGEPLLRKDFKEIYLYTRKMGIKVLLFTNGTLIDKETARLFSKYPPGEKIEITFYGTNEKEYEKASGAKGNYTKALSGIDLLIKYKIPFIVKGLYFAGREKQVSELEKLSQKIPYMQHMPSFSMNFDLRARRDSDLKNKTIKSLRVSGKDTMQFIFRRKDAYIKGMKLFAEKFMFPPGNKVFTCGCGKSGAVDAYGFFQPCLLMRHPNAVYDLKQGSIEEGLDFFAELREIKSENIEYLEKCAKCFLHGLCECCPAKSWMEHGTLDSPVDYYCEIAHAQARFLGLLKETEFGWEVKDWQKRINSFVSG